MADIIPVYTNQFGATVSASVVKVVELIDRMADKYERIGREDAAKNRQALPARKFMEIAKRELAEDPQMEAFIAEHMYNCYESGYKAQMEDRHVGLS